MGESERASQTHRWFWLPDDPEPQGHCEENAHLERSHCTEDDEFYIPRVMKIKSGAELLDEAMGYIYYYDNVMEHSALKYQTSFAHLKSQLSEIDD